MRPDLGTVEVDILVSDVAGDGGGGNEWTSESSVFGRTDRLAVPWYPSKPSVAPVALVGVEAAWPSGRCKTASVAGAWVDRLACSSEVTQERTRRPEASVKSILPLRFCVSRVIGKTSCSLSSRSLPSTAVPLESMLTLIEEILLGIVNWPLSSPSRRKISSMTSRIFSIYSAAQRLGGLYLEASRFR